jgi:hypothetical protein
MVKSVTYTFRQHQSNSGVLILPIGSSGTVGCVSEGMISVAKLVHTLEKACSYIRENLFIYQRKSQKICSYIRKSEKTCSYITENQRKLQY